MNVPSHLAIIMDGNGRWAKLQGRERTFGHLRGAAVAKTIIERCADLGVQHLTLYAFSTENWLRPKPEVFFLMRLLGRHLRKERESLVANNIRFSTIGDLERLPAPVRMEVRKTEEATANNTGMHLVFALSYGARQELTNTMRLLAEDVAAGRIRPTEISAEMIQNRLETADMPDPDLIIRTSGEYRLSNFLLWQAAYSELYITDTLWPDFSEQELDRAFLAFSTRERRFGRTHALLSTKTADASSPDLDTDLNISFEEEENALDAEIPAKAVPL